MSERPTDRVWLAGQSLAGQSANPTIDRTYAQMAAVARADADALLAELAKTAAPQPNPLAEPLRELVEAGRLVACHFWGSGDRVTSDAEVILRMDAAIAAARKALETQP